MSKRFLAVGAGWIMAGWCGAFLLPGPVDAHPPTLTSAEATIEADGRCRVVTRFDTLAFALNDTSARIGNAPMEELLAGPRAALEARLTESKERFLHGFRVTTDRGPGRADLCEFPTADQVLAWKAATTPVLPVVLAVRWSGRLPAGASTVAFRFPTVLEQVVLTVERAGEEPSAEPVEAGAESTALAIKIPAAAASLSDPGGQPRESSPLYLEAVHRSTQAFTVWFQSRLFCGLSTQ